MDQFDAFKAMGEFWARAGTNFLGMPGTPFAQGAGQGVGQGAGPGQAMPTWPGLQPTDFAGLADAQSALAMSWASATALSTTLAETLRGSGTADPTATAVLARIFDPKAWLGGGAEFDGGLSRMAEGPRLADLWTMERKLGALSTAWGGLQRAQAEHNAVMLDGWTRAAGAFAKLVNERTERGEGFRSAREMMSLWIETANTVLLDVQRSEAFLASQRAMLKATTDLRLAQQEIAAATSELYGQPSRVEMDDVHKGLTELRREVRALRRAAAAATKAEAKRSEAASARENADG
ncbi:poly(R)-hydroxyalkanoic acid synthase subunit PhaE [Methylobacterium trifolii]|uniref:Poly(3-hydroxyalkanoate) polymerase subunit PhaE n=1 Tax=Methylobacterium trifolii TaxID=1003092 RepID=A0ABQ4U623_9HYPH|nr:poly(R)-hydroxyalkanoic acid synthase subunit PhaE [Methylobacterium trifolii]GJE61852.1 hypothetical protein MPOCJGCO_3978 [Methylobacterium trifolii]